jgi:hypothetical protein
VTKRELHHIISKVSKTIIHEAVAEKLGYKKLCARWVPKMLMDDQRMKQVGSALKFLTCYVQEEGEFLDFIVTEDETWVFHHTPESKQQSLHWRHTHSLRTKKFKTSIAVKKIMVSIFWDRKDILLVDFMPPGTTVNAAAYCDMASTSHSEQKEGNIVTRRVPAP